MVSALTGFGLAIGSMDIFGAIFFELMIICMLRRRGSQQKQKPQTNVSTLLGNDTGSRMLWAYLILLNVWILFSVLLVVGIVWHMPQLLLFWLIWCLAGLIFDLVFLLWWCWELIVGDTIDALTNILISLLTMAIELSFIYVVYSIYETLLKSPADQAALKNNPLLQLAYVLF